MNAAILLLPLLAGCPARVDPDDSAPGDSSPGTRRNVVIITIDTVEKDFLGRYHPEWDVTPVQDAFMEQAVVLPDVVVSRGMTSISLASILSGLHPRHHGLRDNEEAWGGQKPVLAEVFQAAGYHTYGFSANMCTWIDWGIDERFCTWYGERPDIPEQVDADRLLTEELVARLPDRPRDKPVFIWVHYMDPHDPYDPVEPYHSEFYPDYTGDFDPSRSAHVERAILDDPRLSAEDQRELQAVYASQLKADDALIGDLLEALNTEGILEDAVVVLGADHGEELAQRTNYTYHGCSFYNEVMNVAWAIQAPGLAARELQGWIPSIDLAPTILELAGIPPLAGVDGVSLVGGMEAGALPARDVFFERGTATAGIITGGLKYVLNPDGDFDGCSPFNHDEAAYANDPVEIYDLATDPGETTNLASSPPAAADEARNRLCTWLLAETWVNESVDAHSVLLDACR